MTQPLNYDEMILLDAEDLAEMGLGSAYESMIPHLQRYVANPVPVVESSDSDQPRYAVTADGTEYVVWDVVTDDSTASWGRATWALFTIINKQLSTHPVKLYALNGGNDLGGMFLTEEQVDRARKLLPHKMDWPYIPTAEPPWYGQPH